MARPKLAGERDDICKANYRLSFEHDRSPVLPADFELGGKTELVGFESFEEPPRGAGT